MGAENPRNTSDGNGTFFMQVIYSTSAERFSTIFSVLMCGVWSIFLNALIIVTIIKSESLHNAHFYLLGAYCCSDILLSISSYWCLGPFFVNDLNGQAVCCAGSVPTVALIFAMMYLAGLMSFERYLYFCKPCCLILPISKLFF